MVSALAREARMTPAQKALWFIESHLGEELTLEQIASVGGVSRFHMVRAFGAAFGLPVMRYVRARRLTQAARSLADGAPDILSVALAAGYASHEAFTRAFREQLGLTPEALRERCNLDNLELMEPLPMTAAPAASITPVRMEIATPLLLVGLSERHTQGDTTGISGQWSRFQPHLGSIPGQVGDVAYGVCYNSDDAGNMDYLSGVEVADFSDVPPGLSRLRIPEQRYAVFRHADHISAIQRTWAGIFNDWLPGSEYMLADAPSFERYGPEFDPYTGEGGLEVWIPVEPQRR